MRLRPLALIAALLGTLVQPALAQSPPKLWDIPLGTPIFVPEYVGLPRPDGTKHDGCFVAEDRGLKVVGRQIDVFTGDPALTTQWNALVPSNRGVHVAMNDPRCRRGG